MVRLHLQHTSLNLSTHGWHWCMHLIYSRLKRSSQCQRNAAGLSLPPENMQKKKTKNPKTKCCTCVTALTRSPSTQVQFTKKKKSLLNFTQTVSVFPHLCNLFHLLKKQNFSFEIWPECRTVGRLYQTEREYSHRTVCLSFSRRHELEQHCGERHTVIM